MRLDEDITQRVQEAEETLAKLDLPEASTALNQLYQSIFVAARLSPRTKLFVPNFTKLILPGVAPIVDVLPILRAS